uniref:Uncharacterized protein n=1 Tax=Glossina palpalis gambiensis TaxID=67801 RepID=A0A1B0BBD4_9MUSC
MSNCYKGKTCFHIGVHLYIFICILLFQSTSTTGSEIRFNANIDCFLAVFVIMKHRITSHGKNTNVACKAILLALLESLHGWFTTYADMDLDSRGFGNGEALFMNIYLAVRRKRRKPYSKSPKFLKMFIWSNLAKRKDKVNLPYYMAFVKSQRYDMLLNMHICSKRRRKKNRRMRRSTGINKTAATCSYNTKKTTLKTFVNGRKAFDLNTLPISL